MPFEKINTKTDIFKNTKPNNIQILTQDYFQIYVIP